MSNYSIFRQGDYIAYSDGSGLYPKGFRIRNQVFNVGDTFNFQGIGIGNKINNRAYAITATTTNSKLYSKQAQSANTYLMWLQKWILLMLQKPYIITLINWTIFYDWCYKISVCNVWFESSVAVGATPYFYNLPQTIHVYDHIATGTSVFAVSAKDEDSDYDGISITLPTPSSYFTLSTGYYNDSSIDLLALNLI